MQPAWHGGDLLSHEERGWLVQVHRASPASPFQKFPARLWSCFLLLPCPRGIFPCLQGKLKNCQLKKRGCCLEVEVVFCCKFGDLLHKLLTFSVIILIGIYYHCQHHLLLQAQMYTLEFEISFFASVSLLHCFSIANGELFAFSHPRSHSIEDRGNYSIISFE